MRSSYLAALLAVLAVSGCDNSAKTLGPPAPRVEGETVAFQPDSPQLASLLSEPAAKRQAAASTLSGKLVWNEDKTVRVYTPFAGRVSRILVQPGDRVGQGQTLAVIASPEFGQAQAEARRAEGDYALAQQNVARVRDLHQHGVAAAKDLNAAEADYARAESELKRTQARLKLYGGGSDIDQTYALKSPLAGVVVEKNINPGQELRPDQMGSAPALFVITNPSSLWVLLDASEKDLPQLRLGKIIAIRTPLYRDADFTARITAVSDFLDPVTRTIKVRALLDNTERRFKGEMFITAEIEHEEGTQLQIPAKAVFFQGGRHFVFVDAGGGRFERREVRIGDSSDGSIVVRSGLSEGQKVVTEGVLLLQQMLQPRRVVN